MIVYKIFRKIKKWYGCYTEWRLRPISVFLFHQVSDIFDESTMLKCDWTDTKQFKKNINVLQQEYTFVPLKKTYRMLCADLFPIFFRTRKYAALTADDGWASLNNVLPWLYEKKIPVTLFVNPGYFDGKHFREKETEKYLLQQDIEELYVKYGNLVTIGLHGWDHTDAKKQTINEFRKSVSKTVEALSSLPNYIPYFAYTYGSFTPETDAILKEFNLIPVLIDGEKNIDDTLCIHRELLDGKQL